MKPRLLGIIVTTLGERKSLIHTLESLRNLPNSVLITIVSPRSNQVEFQSWVSRNLNSREIGFVPDKRLGIYSAYNLGLEKSETKWILYLNDDDVLNTEEIEFVLNSLQNSKAKVHFYGFERKNRSISPLEIHDEKHFTQYLKKGRMLTSHQAQIWSVDLLRELGGYRTKIDGLGLFRDVRLMICGDLDMYIRANLRENDYCVSNRILSRVGADGISENRKFRRIIEGNLVLLNNNVTSTLRMAINIIYLSMKFLRKGRMS